MNEGLRALLLVLAGLVVILVVLLIALRASEKIRERRETERADRIRQLLLAALLGDPDESVAAFAELRRRRGGAWRHIESQALAMLPKIKGYAHDLLVELLLSRGAGDQALARLRSRSAVTRARGAYQLGALAPPRALRPLLTALRDQEFVVRRTAVRALGQLADPAAVSPLLASVVADQALTRDVLAALGRIGGGAADSLREDLESSLDRRDQPRRAVLAAMALGLVGDVSAAPVLSRALAADDLPGVPAAAAEALGELGIPTAVPALTQALSHEDEVLRIEAARALGQISDPASVPGLTRALGSGAQQVDRAVAAALLRMGDPGLRALARHTSSYATEALAVHSIRSGVRA